MGALAPAHAQADRKADSAVVFGAAEVKFRGAKSTHATSLKAEGGFDFNGKALDGGFTTSVFVKAPARQSEGSYRTRLDEFSSGWRGGLTLAYEWTDQSTRGYTAHPCMVLLRRSSSLADTQADLEVQRNELASELAQPSPSAPKPAPGMLTEGARETLETRAAVLAHPVAEDDIESNIPRAELALIEARLEHAAWAQAINEQQERDHASQVAAFEESRTARVEETRSEIEALTRSVAAEEGRIADANRELDTRGAERTADGHCVDLPRGWKVRLVGSGEFGGQTYAWRPLDAEDAIERARFSGAAQLTVDAVVTQRPSHEAIGWVFGPAFTARYTQEWSDEGEVGVLDTSLLDPATTGEMRIDPRVVGAPFVEPTLSARLFSYFAPPTPKRMFAFGPALALTFVGEAQTREGVYAPLGDKLAARGEFWLYFMPTATDTVNTRFGIAPFFDATVVGRDAEDPIFETGAFVSFQVGKPVYRY